MFVNCKLSRLAGSASGGKIVPLGGIRLRRKNSRYPRSGQSLVEILVAAAVGSVIIGAAVGVISPALQGSKNAEERQAAAALGKELLENARAFGENNWHNIDALATGSGNHYYVNALLSPFTVVSGDEAISLTTNEMIKNYTRYFYVDTVLRNGGSIAVSGVPDPSTKKITVVFGRTGGTMRTIDALITRSKNTLWTESDWSGGLGVSFSSSSANINYASTTGSVYLNL